uniref:Putative hemolymph juvenile hormone binding protein n=2 Tax=Anopheles triannulatus TaxID=58253 RepID=A0A2M4AV12_9DIPT
MRTCEARFTMARPLIVLLSFNLVLLISSVAGVAKSVGDGARRQAAGEALLSEQLFAIIDHYKEDNPRGLPGATIPDPMHIPDIRQSVSIATIYMTKMKVFGMAQFEIRYFHTELNSMAIQSQIAIAKIEVKGNYTMNALFNRADGPFTVIMKNVLTKANVTLAVDREGQLHTDNIELDISFEDMAMDFQNLGFMGSIFQSVVNSASNLVYDTIKPYMLSEAYSKIREEVDGRMRAIAEARDFALPNSITPLDMAIGELRGVVRAKGLDPFLVPDYNNTAGIFAMRTLHTWLKGGSSFYRYGDISVTMENNTATVGLHVATQRLTGSTHWEISVGRGLLSRMGRAQFTVEYIRVGVQIMQPLDLRRKIQLKDIQLELGNIQVRCDGAGTLDYLVEAVVNVLPNLLRYQIMDAIENPLRMRIQEKLDCINTEWMVRKYAVEFEQHGMNMTLQDFELCHS